MMDQVRVSRAAIGTHSQCHTMQRSRDQSIPSKVKLVFCRCEQYFGAMQSVNKVLATEDGCWVTGSEIAHTMPDTQAVRVQPFRMARIFAKDIRRGVPPTLSI